MGWRKKLATLNCCCMVGWIECGEKRCAVEQIASGRTRLVWRTLNSANCRTTHLDGEPGASVGPPLLGRGHGDTERSRCLVETHPDEVTQLHQFGLARIEGGEFIQRFIQR